MEDFNDLSYKRRSSLQRVSTILPNKKKGYEDVHNYIQNNIEKIYTVDGQPLDEANHSFYVFSNNGEEYFDNYRS